MKIKVISTHRNSKGLICRAGTVLETSNEEGARMISQGLAEDLQKPKKKTRKKAEKSEIQTKEDKEPKENKDV